jgi:hypothetical protein
MGNVMCLVHYWSAGCMRRIDHNFHTVCILLQSNTFSFRFSLNMFSLVFMSGSLRKRYDGLNCERIWIHRNAVKNPTNLYSNGERLAALLVAAGRATAWRVNIMWVATSLSIGRFSLKLYPVVWQFRMRRQRITGSLLCCLPIPPHNNNRAP